MSRADDLRRADDFRRKLDARPPADFARTREQRYVAELLDLRDVTKAGAEVVVAQQWQWEREAVAFECIREAVRVIRRLHPPGHELDSSHDGAPTADTPVLFGLLPALEDALRRQRNRVRWPFKRHGRPVTSGIAKALLDQWGIVGDERTRLLKLAGLSVSQLGPPTKRKRKATKPKR
jgi:hypothetical protein